MVSAVTLRDHRGDADGSLATDRALLIKKTGGKIDEFAGILVVVMNQPQFQWANINKKLIMAEESFDVETLATFLHLTPDQVRKMADRGKLPGRRVNDRWKFSRAEIHHWFEERIGISDESGLKQVEQVLETQAKREATPEIALAELLRPELISVPLLARTKSSVIDGMCQFTADSGALWDPGKMKEAIRAREQLHPTALESGVAFLHPRRPMPGVMEDSFLALGITSSGIPFGGPRGVLTDVFFLICSASDAIHLRILARLSRLVGQAELIDELRQVSGPTQARELILEAESVLPRL